MAGASGTPANITDGQPHGYSEPRPSLSDLPSSGTAREVPSCERALSSDISFQQLLDEDKAVDSLRMLKRPVLKRTSDYNVLVTYPDKGANSNFHTFTTVSNFHTSTSSNCQD